MREPNDYDVMIIGAGMVGLLLAKALAQNAFRVAVIEVRQPTTQWSVNQLDARVCALNQTSWQILENVGIAAQLHAPSCAPLRRLCVWDSVGGGEVEFDSADINSAQLGYIVENREIIAALWQSLQTEALVDFYCPAHPKQLSVMSMHVQLTLDPEDTLSARLIVGADGAHSWLRDHMVADVVTRPYQQHAIVAVIDCEKAHEQTGWQSFMSTGPLGVLPLADSHRAAIVWSTTPADAERLLALDPTQFNVELTNALGGRLGYLTLQSKPHALPLVMRHAQHYVGERMVLVGDAAHTIHPLAGQGVNLGFLDAACLLQSLLDARNSDRDIGSRRPLRRYERWRKGDNTLMIGLMRGFKDVFTQTSPVWVQLRSQALNMTQKVSWLKRFFIHQAAGRRDTLPNLARRENNT